MKLFKLIPKMTQTRLSEMADVVGVTHDSVTSQAELDRLKNRIINILTQRGVKDHAKVIADHPVKQEKPPKYLYEIKESSCFGRMFDARDPYCSGKCGFAQECVDTLERLALQVAQGQTVLTHGKKGRSIMALKKPKTEEKSEKKTKKAAVEEKPAKKGTPVKVKKAAPVEEEAPKKKKAKEAEEEAPKKKKKKAAPVEEEAPKKKKKAKEAEPEKPAKKGDKKGGTAGATVKKTKKAITPFGEGRFLKILVEKNPLQKKDTAYDLVATLVDMAKTATKSRLTQEQFYKAIDTHFVLPEDEAKATEQIKEVAEELKQKAVAKIILLKAE